MTDYKYLFVIRCKIDEDYTTKFIPSFITNQTVGYFVKSIDDVIDIIKEVFLVWRYYYHSNPDVSVKNANLKYMQLIIQKVRDLRFFPYIDFTVGNGKSSGRNDCWFKIYPMHEDFVDLLDLIYKENKPELINKKIYSHRIIPYMVYTDSNPNRLRVHISQNSEYITKGINQTFLLAREIYNYDYYAARFEKLGLIVKNPRRFTELLKSGSSFLLTSDDFKSTNELLYAHIYFLTPINESVTTVQQNLYYVKMDYVIKMCNELFYPKVIYSDIGTKVMSFL